MRLRLHVSILNFGLRGIGLAGRFLLALYLAKFLKLSDVGLFGLITGVANVMPASAGWGLNYYLNREIIGKSRLDSGTMVRNRLAVTIVSLAVIAAVAMPFILALHVLPGTALSLLALAIIVLECVASDIHTALICLGHPLAANTLLFVRSASWVFPAALLGFLFPDYRSLFVVLGFWLAGLCLNFFAMGWVLRDWPLREILRSKLDGAWTLTTIRRSWMIYLSDLGNCGAQFLDRYVVNYFLGLSLTGVFTLYWSIANSVHVLVTTAILQTSFPALVAKFNAGKQKEGSRLVRRMLLKVAVLATGLSAVGAVTFPIVLSYIGKANIAAYASVFWVLLLGICVRLIADGISVELSCRHFDRTWAYTNILGMVLALVFSIVSVNIFGLVGTGISVIATYATLSVIRLRVLATWRPPTGLHGQLPLERLEGR